MVSALCRGKLCAGLAGDASAEGGVLTLEFAVFARPIEDARFLAVALRWSQQGCHFGDPLRDDHRPARTLGKLADIVARVLANWRLDIIVLDLLKANSMHVYEDSDAVL